MLTKYTQQTTKPHSLKNVKYSFFKIGIIVFMIFLFGEAKTTTPTIQARIINYSIKEIRHSLNDISVQIKLDLNKGNGENCIIFYKQGDIDDFIPTDDTTYTTISSFSRNGWWIIYKGKSDSCVKDIHSCGTFSFKVFAYSGTNGSEKYLKTVSAANSITVKTRYYSNEINPDRNKPTKPQIDPINKLCPGDSADLRISGANMAFNYYWVKNSDTINKAPFASDFRTRLDKGSRYKVIVNAGLCADSSVVVVDFKSSPEKPDIYTNNGPNIYYVATTNEKASNYQWYYNGNKISGANKYYYEANKKLGTYYVEITENGFECNSIKSDALTIPLGATSIDKIIKENELNLSPNPAIDYLYLKINNKFYGIISVSVFDMLGKRLDMKTFEKNSEILQYKLSVDNLKSGCYILQIQMKDETKWIKFIKK